MFTVEMSNENFYTLDNHYYNFSLTLGLQPQR
jgi:hypothetical protein